MRIWKPIRNYRKARRPSEPNQLVGSTHLESEVYKWILNQPKIGFSVSTTYATIKSEQILQNFENRSRKLLHWWAFRFIKRHSLVIRRPNPIFQYIIEDMRERRVEFVQLLMTLV